uniref:Dynein regulatory complex subunit 3 n=1 Tax=Neogobius melanostomus TaxID=47308 RepID=A0A8C6T4L6_9GOBI
KGIMYGKGITARLTEENLRSVVAEQRVKGPTGHSVSQLERLEFSEVQKLDLGFKGISIIENLWEFTSLTTLHLNNNFIQKLEGLSRLTNLSNLNLSFNKIMEIEGLESLKKLKELNLSSNNISVLDNFDSLENLVSFNIADNNLKDLNQVMYLRKFKNLFTLNFSGNPLCEEDNYIWFVIAFFPNLKFLDYRYVKSDTVSILFILYNLSQNLSFRGKSFLQDAFVESLNGPLLFEDMIKDDPLANQLQSVPEVLLTFQQKMTELCVQLFEAGLVELRRRQAEVNAFFTSHSIIKAEIMQEESHLLEEFDKYFKMVNYFICCNRKVSSPPQCNFHLFKDEYHQKVQGIVAATIENVEKDEDVDDLPDDVKIVFLDKETVMEALATAHENHLLTIRDRESQLNTRANAWKSRLVKKLKEEEVHRNRVALTDFTTYVDHYEEELRRLFNR